jgi:ppGpp synthetase/RelA/SpoT-type nucleotidyltranferase
MNIEEYERTGRACYAEFAEAVASVLKASITARGRMRPQDIQRRAKDADALRRKLARDGRERSDAIEDDVKDLAGVRLVFYTNNAVHRFGQTAILSDNFDVDYERSKIHYPSGTGEDEPFFISENWVVRLKAERTVLPEYARFEGIKCEIQIQTALDQVWAEMAQGSIAFVLAVLSAYKGKFLLHPMLRDIVDILSEGDGRMEGRSPPEGAGLRRRLHPRHRQ